MPRPNRSIPDGQVCHVTHRCHDRRFRLRFDVDRRRYRWWLWQGLQRFSLSVLGYCLTSNHVHLLLYARHGRDVSHLVQLVHSRVAQEWNRRKRRSGAFWADRFHSTLVDTGEHLWRCLLYIEMNMVRARAVEHPSQWRWCSYADLRSARQRHRVLDMPALLALLSCSDLHQFKRNQDAAIAELLATDKAARNPIWSESMAVGSELFVGQATAGIRNRQSWEFDQHEAFDGTLIWSVKESNSPYGTFFQETPRYETTGGKK